jgi:nicotinamide-nucleotide amidase
MQSPLWRCVHSTTGYAKAMARDRWRTDSPQVSAGPPQAARCDALKEGRRFADRIHGRLVALGQTVAAAESLTGGMISALLTEMAGTTVTFRGGLVVYATDVKHSIAGVNDQHLAEHGPVHSVIAKELACQARQKLNAGYGIGVTGVAGPGEQDGHPLGEVFIAIASDTSVEVKRYEFDGTRGDIRMATTAAALSDLLDALNAACGDG